MKHHSLRVCLLQCMIGLLVLLPTCLSAEQFGLFTYEVIDGTTVEITDYPDFEQGHVDIPAEIDGKPVTSIGDHAFSPSFDLTSINIPNSVTSIGERAFLNCFNLTSITIPSSVTSIGNEALWLCHSLTSIEVEQGNTVFSSSEGVLFNHTHTTLIQYPYAKSGAYTIPSTVTSINEEALFSGNLTSIEVEQGNAVYSSSEGVLFNLTHTTLIQYPLGKVGSYTIPNSVTHIGNNAFFGSFSLTSISIPNGVTHIGDRAFKACINLSNVTIPTSVTSINSDAFYDCSSLTSTYFLGNAPSIGSNVFNIISASHKIYYLDTSTGFDSLPWSEYPAEMVDTSPDLYTYVVVGGTTVTITDYPTDKIGAISIPESIEGKPVTSIGPYAFQSCSSLTSAIIPNSVTSMDYAAFHSCSSLTNVSIPNSITTIASSAFSHCSNLESIMGASGNRRVD